MAEKPITNPGNTSRYVAGRLIAPGETRLIPQDELPPNLHEGGILDQNEPESAEVGGEEQQNPSTDQDKALKELLEQTVPSISEALPKLSAEDLDRLEQLEEAAEKPRKGVLEAVAEERLNRAQV
jgi:hypothetical protein